MLWVVELGKEIENTTEGSVLLTFYGLAADIERRNIIGNARRGGKKRAEVEHRKNGGIPSFGFDMIDGRYVINEEEAEYCRMMRGWLLEGITPGLISQKLMSMRVGTKYDRLGIVRKKGTLQARQPFTWWPSQVRRILTDRLYHGELVYRAWDGTEIVTEVPPIFTPAEVEEHRRLIQLNVSTKKREDGEINLLRGLVRCGECGRRYIANRASRNANYQRLYRCGDWRKPNHLRSCRNKTWTAKKLESAVWAAVVGAVTAPERVMAGLQAAGGSDRPELRLELLQRRLGQLDVEDGRVREGLRAGIFSVEQAQAEMRHSNTARTLINVELREITDRLEQKQRTDDLTMVLRQLRDRVRKATPDQRAAVLREIVERITVTGNAIEIQLLLLPPVPIGEIGQAVPRHARVVFGPLRVPAAAVLVRRDREGRQWRSLPNRVGSTLEPTAAAVTPYG